MRRGVLVAVVEVLAVVVLAWLTWWCWQRGVIITEHNGVTLRRIEGRWWAAATSAATLAGILILRAAAGDARAPASVRGQSPCSR